MNHFFACYNVVDRETNEDLKTELEKRITTHPELLHPLARHLWRTFGVVGMNSDGHIGEYIPYAYEYVGTRWLFGRENRKVLEVEDEVSLTDVYDAWRFKRDLGEYMNSEDRKVQKEMMSGKRPPNEETIASSGELAVAIIGDILLNRKVLRPAVNVLNTEGYIENLSREGCIEVPAVVDSDGIHPEYVGKLPEGFAAQIRIQHSIQKLLVEAFAKKSKQILLQALLLDPVVDSSIKAEQMLNYMLEIQADYLPKFS
jgi:alpha-galactosidase